MPRSSQRFRMPSKLTQRPEWKVLTEQSRHLSALDMRRIMTEELGRFGDFSIEENGFLFDFSRHPVTGETVDCLCDLAKACDVEGWRDRMVAGEKINISENRAALHTALRQPTGTLSVDGENILTGIHNTLGRMKHFSAAVRNGSWKGHSGQSIRTVVHIGIGGSDLGPRMVTNALNYLSDGSIKVYFVSNVDAAAITATLKQCDPATTLFIIASKTFTTQETMANAHTAKNWALQSFPEKSLPLHFIAVSNNVEAAEKFGIATENIYPLADWVGGRYSIWSSIGLPVCLAVGFEHFRAFLDGGYAMDQHFLSAPLKKNIPVMMALLGIWQRNFLDVASHAVIPYDARLALFSSYLQQLEMESNGKSVDREGRPVTDYDTAPVIFGTPGTNAQHSFFQLLHQGTDRVSVDVIAACHPDHDHPEHHHMLLANMAAQAQAFMAGRTAEEANGDYNRVFEGNRAVSTILVDRLDPFNLGRLLAAYEHKVFVQGIIWNINSFDQFGVELGKEIANNIVAGDTGTLDQTTKNILRYAQSRTGE